MWIIVCRCAAPHCTQPPRRHRSFVPTDLLPSLARARSPRFLHSWSTPHARPARPLLPGSLLSFSFPGPHPALVPLRIPYVVIVYRLWFCSFEALHLSPPPLLYSSASQGFSRCFPSISDLLSFCHLPWRAHPQLNFCLPPKNIRKNL